MNPDPTAPTPPNLATIKANAEKAISGKTLALMAVDPVAIVRAYLDALEQAVKDESYYAKCKDETAATFMNQVKKLQEHITELERENERLTRKLLIKLDAMERGCQEPVKTVGIKPGLLNSIEKPTIRVLGSGGDYEDHPNPNYKSKALQPTLTFSDALRIARGRLKGFNYSSTDIVGKAHIGGIQTVINALEAAQKGVVCPNE